MSNIDLMTDGEDARNSMNAYAIIYEIDEYSENCQR